jgi:hypothetical protein
MKKILFLALVAMMATMSATAQKIRTIDTDGQPVPFVSVLTTDSKIIGVTDADGYLADVKGADTIAVSHVAYKPKLYKMNDKGGTITLEDADFGLPEIVVKKKPYIYVQTYYRMYMYTDEYGMGYYRVGVTDNVYDVKTKKLKTSTTNASKAKYGIIKTLIGAAMGGKMNQLGSLPLRNPGDKLKSNKSSKFKVTDEGPGRKRISDSKGTIGYVVDEGNQRRITLDAEKTASHRLEESGNAKKIAKAEKKAAKKKNNQTSEFFVFRIDEDGKSRPEDYVMMEYINSYDEVQKDGSLDHNVMGFQAFATDRAYVDKDELKQIKKQNKMKMTYQNIRQFERGHNIPALPSVLQQKLNELWKTGE